MRSIPFPHCTPSANPRTSDCKNDWRCSRLCGVYERPKHNNNNNHQHREGRKTRDNVCFHRRNSFFRALSCDSSSNLEEMDSSGGRERRRRSGMGMDQESMCVWTLRTSPSAVVGFNPHSSFPSSFSSLLTWSIPELQIPPCPISTPPTHVQLCNPPPICNRRKKKQFTSKWTQYPILPPDICLSYECYCFDELGSDYCMSHKITQGWVEITRQDVIKKTCANYETKRGILRTRFDYKGVLFHHPELELMIVQHSGLLTLKWTDSCSTHKAVGANWKIVSKMSLKNGCIKETQDSSIIIENEGCPHTHSTPLWVLQSKWHRWCSPHISQYEEKQGFHSYL